MAKKVNRLMFMNSGKMLRISVTVRGPCHPVLTWLVDLKILQQRKHCRVIFHCIKSDEFNVGNASRNVIRPDEMCYAIEKLTMNKACCLDQIAAEHLKYASHRISLCLSGLLMHGILADSVLSVLLVSVVKDKAGKISSRKKYRQIALASLLSKILEHIFLDRPG